MISLNLLSPENKKNTEERLLYLSIKNLLGAFLVFATLSAIILLIAKLLLADNFQTIIEQTTLIVKEYGGVNQKIKETNQKINSVNNTQEKFVAWSVILEKIANLVPQNTTASVMIISRSNEEMTLKGTAKTRNDLLLLKSNLESSDVFSSVKIPFSNLLTRKNIDFEFELRLNKKIFEISDVPTIAIPEEEPEEALMEEEI
jgi:Tfp pilus assembly protein PilN